MSDDPFAELMPRVRAGDAGRGDRTGPPVRAADPPGGPAAAGGPAAGAGVRLGRRLPVGAGELLRPHRRRPVRPRRPGAARPAADADGPQQARVRGPRQSRQKRDHRRAARRRGAGRRPRPTTRRRAGSSPDGELLDRFRACSPPRSGGSPTCGPRDWPGRRWPSGSGGTAQARRMQLARAADRAAAALGLDGGDDMTPAKSRRTRRPGTRCLWDGGRPDLDAFLADAGPLAPDDLAAAAAGRSAGAVAGRRAGSGRGVPPPAVRTRRRRST